MGLSKDWESMDLGQLVDGHEEREGDVLEEFKYLWWQDVSAEPEKLELLSESHVFVKLNVYKLLDLGTMAHFELQNMKKVVAQLIYNSKQLQPPALPQTEEHKDYNDSQIFKDPPDSDSHPQKHPPFLKELP